MPTSSPGSALSASCTATSTGRAPRCSSTSAAWRSSARRADTGDTSPHRLTRDVVPESEVVAALDEQIRLEELTDRIEQPGGWPLERSREIPERERPAERRGDRRDVARGTREPTKALPHPVLDAMRQPSIDQLSPALDDPDPLLIAKAEEHLDQKVRAAAALFEEPEDVLARLDPQQVGREHRHRDLIEGSDRDLGRAETLHPMERACRWCRLA